MAKSLDKWILCIFVLVFVVLYILLPKPPYYYGIKPAGRTANMVYPGLSKLQMHLYNAPKDKTSRQQFAEDFLETHSDDWKDGWGNRFQVFVDENGSVHDDVRLYSFGEDGHSASRGNDPDDLNSWNKDAQLKFYHSKNPNLARNALKYKRQWLLESVILPLVLSILIVCPFKLFLSRRRSSEVPQI